VQAVDACRRAEIVDDVIPNQFKGLNVLDFHSSFYVFFEDLIDDSLHVGALIRRAVNLNSSWESAFQNIAIQFYFGIGVYLPPIKPLHVLVFVECQWKHFELKVSTGQFRHELPTEQIGI